MLDRAVGLAEAAEALDIMEELLEKLEEELFLVEDLLETSVVQLEEVVLLLLLIQIHSQQFQIFLEL